MNVEEAICVVLRGKSAVTDILGEALALRVYPVLLPEKVVFPAATFDRTDTQRVHHYEGASGLGEQTYDLVAWAKDLGGARAAADAIRRAIDGFQGTVTGADGSTLYVNSVLCDDPAGRGFDYDDSRKVFGLAVSLRIWSNE